MKSLPAICVLILVANGYSQSWCPPGATWKYDTGSWTGVSHSIFHYASDTIIEGFDAQRIDQVSYIVELFGNDTLIEDHGPALYTRSNDDVVWQWIEQINDWDTLYWFGAVPGDVWQPHWAYDENCPSTYLTVIDTGSVTIGNVVLRSLTVQKTDGEIVEEALLIERIGNTTGYFEWFGGCVVANECFCFYLCYSDAEIDHPDNGQTCGLSLNVSDLFTDEEQLLISPNPAWAVIRLEHPIPTSHVQIFDRLGALVLAKDVSRLHNLIDISHLTSGSYVIRSIGDKGIRVGKFIKD